jgi:hypothetical protein
LVKAKVSYDQEKFQVEFNVQDYKPEVSQGPLEDVILHYSAVSADLHYSATR